MIERLVLGVLVAFGALTGLHALLWKRDPRAAAGWIGLTGGMNVGARHMAARAQNPRRVVDVRFRVEGPVVAQMADAFDDAWALVGSANLDPRSLRLNFEFDLEVWDGGFVADLARHFEAARAESREILLAELDGRPFQQRVRDGLAKLVSPFL